MTNHDHFLAVPQRPDSISSTFRMVNAAYARYFHDRLQTCGHLWQDRPYSNPVDADLCWPVLAYIERNPVRAGMVDVASDYPWSSAQFRQLDRNAPKWLDLENWKRQFTPQRWDDVLRTSLDEEAMQQRVREALRRGRPMGCEDFVDEIEAKTGRILRIQKPAPRAKSIANGRSTPVPDLPATSALLQEC